MKKEVEDKREKEEDERRARRERERQARQLMRADRERSVQIIVCSSESQNAVLVSRKFFLNCLLISISGKSTWIELDEGWQAGKKTSFYFLIFFVNRLYSFLPSSLLNARLCFHVIHPHLIIQHKVSFSSRFISFFLF